MLEHYPHICIFGPTASGKSQLARTLAQLLSPLETAVINSDSLQLYSSLPILTAQPTAKDKLQIPHYLYSIAAPTIRFSAGLYAAKTKELLLSLDRSATRPVTIICGGSGLYLKALLSGLTALPTANPEKQRAASKDIHNWQQQNKNLYELLKQRDPSTAENLNPNDSHRIIRALEFFETYNLPLHPTQKKASLYEKTTSLAHVKIKTLVVTLNPPRDILYQTINNRFSTMLKNGAIDEAQNLRKNYRYLPHDSPIQKTLGLLEIYQYLDEKISREIMLSQSQQRTRNYAKRQITWMRHQLQPNLQFEGPLTQSTENICRTIINSLDKTVTVV